MRITDLDYNLPSELIAQTPIMPRDASRLMIVDRGRGTIEDATFHDLPDLLAATDLVVLNATRVLPARLRLQRATGGKAEVLLLEPLADDRWEALVRPARRLRLGEFLEGGVLQVEVLAVREAGLAEVRIHAEGSCAEAIEAAGEMPLPPYIHRTLDDPERYQTVYARHSGSAAAPTAGLHFTPELMQRMREICAVEEVELRVGIDTFRPVAVDDLDQHHMHSEAYSVASETRATIATAAGQGRRIVAVGTTSVRVLETIADQAAPDVGRTSLLIQPGYRFQSTGSLVTNFHLPRSTLLALVMAFAGESLIREAYALAVQRKYRFYSFGDAMVIL